MQKQMIHITPINHFRMFYILTQNIQVIQSWIEVYFLYSAILRQKKQYALNTYKYTTHIETSKKSHLHT